MVVYNLKKKLISVCVFVAVSFEHIREYYYVSRYRKSNKLDTKKLHIPIMN